MTMTTRDVFEAGTAAFNAHDFEAFAAVMDDGVTLRAPGAPPLAGREACVAFFRAWIDAFSDGRVEVGAAHVLDDGLVVEEGRFTGTHDGVLSTPGGDIAPTGRCVSLPYVQLLRIRDGSHASFALTFDRLAMLEQLGLMEEPASPAHRVS
jgi:uncharacterized protein (TIGR02246 family)